MLTLDYFKTHPLRVPKNQRTLTIGQLLAAETATVVSDDIHPTAGAFIHYGGVELADRLVMLKPSLTQDELTVLTQAWYGSCGIVAKQLLFYVWRIITKELRHGSSGMCDKAFADATKWHPDAVALCRKVCAGGDYGTHLTHYPNLPASLYVDAVEQHFRKGGWSGAYGGKKWADIALVFKRYLDGETSAMIAADRAWTLVHNTGPIFNKGFYFTHHDSSLVKVLNAQASTSVFSLGMGFLLSKSGYAHKTSDMFGVFVDLATKAIVKAKPDYVLGDGGAVTADGGKPSGKAYGDDDEDDDATLPYGVKKTVGPYTITTTQTREELPQ